MKNRNHCFALLGCLALLVGLAPSAHAGGVYQLEFTVCGPVPTLPADVAVNLYEGDVPDPGKLKGTSTETFVSNGNIPSHVCDPVACLTDSRIMNGEFCIAFQINGFDKGKLKAESYFEVVINGEAFGLNLHTSCSQPIPLNQPITVGDYTFEIVGGYATCIPGVPGCPQTSKIYEVDGEYRIDVCNCAPTNITFNVYKKDTEFKGTSSATWDGVSLSNIVCDDVACITGATLEGCELVITFDSFGYRDDGQFDSDTSWEMLFDGGCNGGKVKVHTSCSQPFYLNVPHPAGDGTFTFTDGCGGCLSSTPVSVEDSSWGSVKGLYR